MDRIRKWSWTPWVGLALGVLTLASFWGVRECGFLNYDDPEYITRNPHVQSGLSWANVVWAFTSTHAGNWHPLTWMSHMLDCQVFGLNPAPHHLMNAAIHTANTLLLFFLLHRFTGALWRSAIVAALFGVHPLHVESVAWLAERKDVLSGMFFLLTLWAYGRYVEARGSDTSTVRSAAADGHHAPRFYLLAVVLFALGLMSKPMLVTLPFVLLLMDFWPLDRYRSTGSGSTQFQIFNSLLLEKVPFFALSALSCMVTFFAQRKDGAVAAVASVPLDLRLQNAPVSYLVYVAKLFWPADLAGYYPIQKTIPALTAFAAIAAIVVLSVVAWATRRRWPYLSVGWFWYLGMLVPVIGLVQVGLQARADRYTYLPYIGLFIALAWGLADATQTWRRRAWLVGPVGTAAVGACAALTVLQVRYWHDSETLFRRAVELHPDNPVARLNLGSALLEQGKLAAAEEQFTEIVRLHPRYAEAQSNLGFVYSAQGKPDAAISCYNTALALNPRFERTHWLLAGALLTQDKRAEAIAEYRASLQQNPDFPAALNDLAWLLATDPTAHDGAEAVRLAENACRVTNYREPLFIGTLAAAYADAGRFDQACVAAEKAAQVATAAGQPQVAERNQQLLQLYRAGKPFRENAGP